MHTSSFSSWGQSGAGGSARPCLPSLPAEGLPGSAQQVIQVDRDTVLVCFDRECPWYQGWELEAGGEGGQVGLSPQKGATPPRLPARPLCRLREDRQPAGRAHGDAGACADL